MSIVDLETARRVRDIPVGLRPNDLALAPDGRLFVACSGDNTVHVIQTRVADVAPHARGTAVALHAFHFFLGQTVGPAVFGQIARGVGAVPAFLTCGAGLAALAVTLGRRT